MREQIMKQDGLIADIKGELNELHYVLLGRPALENDSDTCKEIQGLNEMVERNSINTMICLDIIRGIKSIILGGNKWKNLYMI